VVCLNPLITFFSVVQSRFLWCLSKDVFGWQLVPVSVSIFQKLVLDQADCKNKQWLIFFFGCAAWCLWLIRNDLSLTMLLFLHLKFVFFVLFLICSAGRLCARRKSSFWWPRQSIIMLSAKLGRRIFGLKNHDFLDRRVSFKVSLEDFYLLLKLYFLPIYDHAILRTFF